MGWRITMSDVPTPLQQRRLATTIDPG